jgi:hypothetical protein
MTAHEAGKSQLLNKTDRHLRDYTLEELETTTCEDCLVNSMAEYACINYIKDNTPVCVDCCGCHREEM